MTNTDSAAQRAPQRFYFSGANCVLSAVDYGNAHLPDMVILHGMRDHGQSMSSLSNAFREQYHLVVPDLRGHGDSDNPGSYTMTQFVADLRALVGHLDLEKPVLVGHSLGGHIASKYAALYPREVSALILIDGMGPPRAEGPRSPEMRLEAWRNNVETALQLSSERRAMKDAAEALGRLTSNNPRLDGETAEMIVEQGVEPHPDGGVRWKWDPAVGMVWSTVDHDESEQHFSLIECPVLVITGSESMQYWSRRNLGDHEEHELLERETARRVKLFRDARHVSIENAGHMVHYDQPEELNRCIAQFLDSE